MGSVSRGQQHLRSSNTSLWRIAVRVADAKALHNRGPRGATQLAP